MAYRYYFLFAAAVAILAFSSRTSLAQSTAQNSRGAFGQRTLGGGFGGNNGAGGMQSINEGAGQVSGNDRFVRGSRNGAFVGADRRDSANTRSQTQNNTQQNPFGNILGNALNQLNRFGQFGNRGQTPQNSAKQLRFRMTTAIEPSSNQGTSSTSRPSGGASVATVLSTRLSRLPAISKSGSIQVRMDGRTAVLSGEVATDRDRKLAAGVAMLEPGVSSVRNELQVKSR